MPEISRPNRIGQLAEMYLSTSTYAYVANNPVMRFDVDGRWFNDDGTIDTSGYTPRFTTGKQYRDSFLGLNQNDGLGGGSTGGSLWVGDVTDYNGPTLGDLIDAWVKNDIIKIYDNDGDYIGKMKVAAYDLYTDPDTGWQGIHIELEFTNASKKYSDYKWVQTVGTNNPDGGGSDYRQYNDRRFPYENHGPFYYAKKDYVNNAWIKEGNKYIFRDVPIRAKDTYTIGWRAELSLVGFNSSGAHAVHTVTYGFNLYPSGHSLTMPLMSIPYTNRYWWLKK